MRYFEKVSKSEFTKYFKEELYDTVKLPERKTQKSAGYDFYLVDDVYIKAHETVVIPTGIKAYYESDEALLILIRSSIGIKENVILSNSIGLIDADYYNNIDNEGHLMVAITNLGNDAKCFKKGGRIAQGIFINYLCTEDDAAKTDRIGGIGSTGRRD